MATGKDRRVRRRYEASGKGGKWEIGITGCNKEEGEESEVKACEAFRR